jgi:hypothetical protein
MARSRAILTEFLVFTDAHLTTEQSAQTLGDRLRALWHDVRDAPESPQTKQLQEIIRDMEKAKLPYEDWEVLYRERVTIEKKLLLAGSKAPRR